MSTVTTSIAIEFSPVLGHHVYAGTDVPALSPREAEIVADLVEDEFIGGQEPADTSYGDEERS